jgi:hypothetical protein
MIENYWVKKLEALKSNLTGLVELAVDPDGIKDVIHEVDTLIDVIKTEGTVKKAALKMKLEEGLAKGTDVGKVDQALSDFEKEAQDFIGKKIEILGHMKKLQEEGTLTYRDIKKFQQILHYSNRMDIDFLAESVIIEREKYNRGDGK